MGLKRKLYQELVTKRKLCRKCNDFINPSVVEGGVFDSDRIGPWSLWQGSLDAEILIVGKDWGPAGNFLGQKGKDSATNATNISLIKLVRSIGIEIEGPGCSVGNDLLFFTNCVLCLKKTDKASGHVKNECFVTCGKTFLKPLIDIIKPKIVIALGEDAYRTIAFLYGVKQQAFAEAVEKKEVIALAEDMALFAVYHCAPQGINVNRDGFSQHVRDWEKIKNFLCKNNVAYKE